MHDVDNFTDSYVFPAVWDLFSRSSGGVSGEPATSILVVKPLLHLMWVQQVYYRNLVPSYQTARFHIQMCRSANIIGSQNLVSDKTGKLCAAKATNCLL
jgi:hypothetical protein